MSQLFVETLSKTTEIEIYKDNIIIKRLDLDLSINLNTLRTIIRDEMGSLDWFFTKDNNEITRDEELIRDCYYIFNYSDNRITTTSIPLTVPSPFDNLNIQDMTVTTVDLEDANLLQFIGVTADWLLTGGEDKMLTVINRATN